MTTAGEVERALVDAARLEADDDVLVLGGGALVFGARERVGDGWVYVVRSEVDELEKLLGEAHALGASGVAYLVGEALVLPLPDDAVAAAIGRVATDDGPPAAAAAELARVVVDGGRVALAASAGFAAEVAEALRVAGFDQVELAEAGSEVVVSGRRG